jgi:uncharacterized repeat protein (TIGR03803 family)
MKVGRKCRLFRTCRDDRGPASLVWRFGLSGTFSRPIFGPAGCLFLVAAAFAVSAWLTAAQAQTVATLTTLTSFTNPVGPTPALIQGSDGELYGVAPAGGSHGYGSAFRISLDGVLTRLASFELTNALPVGGLVQGSDGNFYGTTSGAGTGGGHGTVFRLTPDGALTTLFSFSGSDGDPRGRLIQASDGSFYGTTEGWYNSGTVFRVTTNGDLTTLVSFNVTNGGAPFAGLVEASNGYFYGTTYYGGSTGLGTVFKMTPAGELTTLISFTNTARAAAGLVQGSDGSLYGTTAGMSNSPSSIYPGIVYRMTPEGAFTTLATPFNYDTWPGTLIQASDGNFYGTTSSGGSRGLGTLFQVSPDGVFTTLLEFNCSNGASPSDLMQATNGLLYGTTRSCGQYGYGTAFQISLTATPRLQNPSIANNLFSLNWNAIPGRAYRVEYSTNLGSSNWCSYNSHMSATGSVMTITHPVNDSARLYRVVLLP